MKTITAIVAPEYHQTTTKEKAHAQQQG